MTAIRVMGVDDLDALHALDRESQPLPWSDDQLLLELVHDEGRVLGAFEGEALVGHVCLRKMVDELWVLNLAVLPAARRQGHAQALLQAAVQFGRAQRMLSVWLEVRENNRGARALYEKAGFEQRGRRPHYYPALPTSTTGEPEAAILMSRPL